jgi:hypothetical protein
MVHCNYPEDNADRCHLANRKALNLRQKLGCNSFCDLERVARSSLPD